MTGKGKVTGARAGPVTVTGYNREVVARILVASSLPDALRVLEDGNQVAGDCGATDCHSHIL